MSRELNTIGSKANDAEIAQTIVETKTELENKRTSSKRRITNHARYISDTKITIRYFIFAFGTCWIR